MTPMRSFSEIIDKFGAAVLARILKVDESHVRTMKARDSIPPEYWGPVVDNAPEYGIEGLDHHKLRRLRKSRFANARASA